MEIVLEMEREGFLVRRSGEAAKAEAGP